MEHLTFKGTLESLGVVVLSVTGGAGVPALSGLAVCAGLGLWVGTRLGALRRGAGGPAPGATPPGRPRGSR